MTESIPEQIQLRHLINVAIQGLVAPESRTVSPPHHPGALWVINAVMLIIKPHHEAWVQSHESRLTSDESRVSCAFQLKGDQGPLS